MNTGERYEFNKELDYRLTRAHKKTSLLNDLNSSFSRGERPVALFINPAVALSVAGSGLGALKGSLEQDPYGQYIGGQERLNRVALNALGGGLIGGSAGLSAKYLGDLGVDADLPAQYKKAKEYVNLPSGKKVAVPPKPDPVELNPVEAFQRFRGNPDVIDTRASTIDDITRQAELRAKRSEIIQQQVEAEKLAREARLQAIREANAAKIANNQQRIGGVVDDIRAKAYETPVIGPQIQQAVDRVADFPVWRKKVGPEVPVPSSSSTLENIKPVVQGVSSAVSDTAKPVVNTVQDALNNTGEAATQASYVARELADEFAPDIKGLGRKVVDRSKQDINKVKGWVSNAFRRPPVDPNSIDGNFSFMDNNISRFGILPRIPIETDNDAYRLSAGLGAVGGATLLGLNSAADTIYKQQYDNNSVLSEIMSEPDPNIRVMKYKQYTESPDSTLRQAGNANQLMGNTALGAGAGAIGGGLLAGGTLAGYKRLTRK